MKSDFNDPVSDILTALSLAFNRFNYELFNGCLPACVITFSESEDFDGECIPQYAVVTRGGEVLDVVNIGSNILYDVYHTLAVMVHEMVHVWQMNFGNTTDCDHNYEWINKMEEIGLLPINADPEAKESDPIEEFCSEIVIYGGKFETIRNQLLEEKVFSVFHVLNEA